MPHSRLGNVDKGTQQEFNVELVLTQACWATALSDCSTRLQHGRSHPWLIRVNVTSKICRCMCYCFVQRVLYKLYIVTIAIRCRENICCQTLLLSLTGLLPCFLNRCFSANFFYRLQEISFFVKSFSQTPKSPFINLILLFVLCSVSSCDVPSIHWQLLKKV